MSTVTPSRRVTTTAGFKAGSPPASRSTGRSRSTRRPRIPKKQTTVDWETGEEKEAQVIGRHDPVLPPRGVPVVEAMAALTMVDFMLLGGRINPDRLDGQVGEYDTDYHPSSPENDPEDAPTSTEPTDALATTYPRRPERTRRRTPPTG